MTGQANAARGEASLPVDGVDYILRPSFTALVAAEEELGPLFALVQRAGDGQLRLAELSGLFWHCLAPGHGLARDQIEGSVCRLGLAACAGPLRALLGQILQGQA